MLFFVFVCVCSGGSILSTRCSETYETKTALMSLFGLPLWYFSQSPRVVIQVSLILTSRVCLNVIGLVATVLLIFHLSSFCLSHELSLRVWGQINTFENIP